MIKFSRHNFQYRSVPGNIQANKAKGAKINRRIIKIFRKINVNTANNRATIATKATPSIENKNAIPS
ncbi:hypothetical protein KW801_03945, partial [Candidatus Saccharibacteria bacterium]|nr:hypothetical protein [Candidatus Saccharibacteria bacterium]